MAMPMTGAGHEFVQIHPDGVAAVEGNGHDIADEEHGEDSADGRWRGWPWRPGGLRGCRRRGSRFWRCR